MRVHVDHPWSRCVREFHAPIRVYVTTKRWHVTVGQHTQRWDPRYGYTDKWSFISWSPTDEYRCHFRLEAAVTCPLRKGHRGRHWNWKQGWLQRYYRQ